MPTTIAVACTTVIERRSGSLMSRIRDSTMH
jgi:hypothetical protein